MFNIHFTNLVIVQKSVHERPFLFRIPTKDTVVVFYSTLSPKKCTKLNTEKQHAQDHLGSNLTPEGENRNF